MIDLSKLTTEMRNPNTMNLDQMTPLEFVEIMNKEDGKVIEAVGRVIPEVSKVITWATDAVSKGGRLIYMGAGTSGRLGLMDAVECPPTFGVAPGLVIGTYGWWRKSLCKGRRRGRRFSNLRHRGFKELSVK